MREALHEFGTADATGDVAQKVGNGAIVNFLTCGRPHCDGGQAVESSKGYGAETGRPRNSREKSPSLPASTIESGGGRARIAKERRGSGAMARITGLNQCSPPLLFWAGLACASARFRPMQWFSRAVRLCYCTQGCSVGSRSACMFSVCNAIRVSGCGTARARLRMAINARHGSARVSSEGT